MERDLELENFYKDCNEIINGESFNSKLERDFYRVYKGVKEHTISGVCKNCIMYDAIKHKCICEYPINKKAIYCWKANNVKILKGAKLYGQKNNIKPIID